MGEEEGNKTGRDQRWEGPNVLGGEWRGLGDKGEGVRGGAVEARLNEESEEGEKTAEAWKITNWIPLHWGFHLKIIFHTPNLTSNGKWASEKV